MMIESGNKLRILMLHNYYQQRGGEEESTEQEVGLLQSHGHEVRLVTRHNDEINEYNNVKKAALFFTPTWSTQSRRTIENRIQTFKPDIVHIQNFFPLLSPAVHVACSKAGIPVIQSLHNYRLLAPCALLSRNNTVCEKCLSGTLWNGIALRCYRNSTIQTASVALMIKTHRVLRTWEKHVDTFVALTGFVRDKFIESGFDSSKIVVRSNFLGYDPGIVESERTGAVYLGRLSEEKGIRSLLEAWRLLPRNTPLSFIGDGPMREWMSHYVEKHQMTSVRILGYQQLRDALEIVRKASFLVVPSISYETFGRIIIEAYATGTPALVSGHGAIGSLVTPNKTGLHFIPGDANDLAEKARYMFENPDEVAEWGVNARAEFLAKYTAESAYRSLMEIYESAIERRRAMASRKA